MEALIEKLNCITAAWQAQFPVSPDLPLLWKVEDGLLFLDNVWITPVKYIKQESLAEAVAWVNEIAMEIELIDGMLDIFITKWLGEYAIAGVERTVV